jgi:ferredoxin-NADP reductase
MEVNPAAVSFPQRRSALGFFRSGWLRPLNDVAAIDDLVGQVNRAWSLGTIKARAVAVVAETSDTRTFFLRPNRNWPGFIAGQHVTVEVEIDGVRHRRCYSLSSAPGGRKLAITVKRQPGGKVSSWLHDHLYAGSVVTLSQPAGDFVLPEPLPERLLLLSAGSGITPLMSMVRDAHRRGYGGDVAFVHACRDQVVFGSELARLEQIWPALRVHLHFSAVAGRLDLDGLARLVPDYAERHTMLCGPQAFMAQMRAHWRERGIERRLQVENFGVPVESRPGGREVEVRLARSERTFVAPGSDALLLEAERAGLTPRYGCRIGICRSCQCVKSSGTVENLLTGQVSSQPDERIQLCITRARSSLVLDL